LTPVLLIAAAELIARAVWPEGALPVFVEAPFGDGRYRVANRELGRRWFLRERVPPAPMLEPFAAQKPPRGLRIFVLGESATAGFPYPRNGTFSRVLRDMLRDVLPDDSVEVVNLGIAATNSYALLDVARDVAAQNPDAVVIYAGHNEYYGALGAASSESAVGNAPLVKRTYLWMLRSRLVLAMRNVLGRRPTRPEAEGATLMEALGRGKEIPLGSPTYQRGIEQFEGNLTRVVRVFRERNVPVFVGSLASNIRDQRPFAAPGNRGPARAEGAFLDARRALAAEDLSHARTLYERARDLDVVRFRAPQAFNDVIRRVTAKLEAVYVPVAESAAREAIAGAPGAEAFLEHVHFTRDGNAMVGRVFFDALRDAHFLGRAARMERLRSPRAYRDGMELTPLDERIVTHTVRTLTLRWPFVPLDRQRDYRASYRPSGLLDSLSFTVSRGAPWESAKLGMAKAYEGRSQYDSAAAEYRGLVRDAPLFEEPWRLLGSALIAGGHREDAERSLEQAIRIRPTVEAANALAGLALDRRDLPRGIALLQQSLSLQPNQPDALHRLSMAYALAGDIGRARMTAAQLRQLSPGREGLAEWMEALGMR
jgi:tetratricopeptide (TPR) repeat protein